jgi:hypothetical protein
VDQKPKENHRRREKRVPSVRFYPLGAFRTASLNDIPILACLGEKEGGKRMVTLPTLIDFNQDIPGQPPATGGNNQPTSLFTDPGTSIIVQPSANRINTQPVLLTASAPDEFANVATDFSSVSTGVLRVETTVSFDKLTDGYFLQTAVPLAVLTRLDVFSSGQIEDDASRTVVGNYTANNPFTVSIDVDMDSHTWSVAINNVLTTNLPFENPINVLPQVGEVDASLQIFPVHSSGASVAYDGISISLLGQTITKGNGDFTLDIGSNSTVTLGNGDDTITGGQNNTIKIGNGDQSITLSGGNNRITLGKGDSTISVGGSGNKINLSNGNDTVHGGTGDTINITKTTLNITGTNEIVFLSPSNARVTDSSTDLTLKIGPTAGKDVLSNFASDPGGVVDLLGGIGGYTSVPQVLSALKSDGEGGTLLPFGHGSSLDFAGVSPSQLHASIFEIG